jgi:hypothetical protein
MGGIGGRSQWWEIDVGIAMQHRDGGTTTISKPLAVIGTLGLPSLLGRDILSNGILTIDGPAGRMTFDIRPGRIN